jgi:5'-nucleotidase
LRILISNDDGIKAPGLQVLEKVARKFSNDVWVVAPDQDQSAISHSLTLRTPFRINEISSQKYSVGGTPTDCIFSSINFLMRDHKPDFVISGINSGANIAEDVTYSGTVAAALEATILGIPAIAFSIAIENLTETKWSTAEHWCEIVLRKLLEQSFCEGVYYNVNIPNVEYDEVVGISITKQGRRSVSDNLYPCKDPRGNPYYWIGPGEQRYHNVWQYAEAGTDLEAIGKKCISITPLSVDITHHATLHTLKELFS